MGIDLKIALAWKIAEHKRIEQGGKVFTAKEMETPTPYVKALMKSGWQTLRDFLDELTKPAPKKTVAQVLKGWEKSVDSLEKKSNNPEADFDQVCAWGGLARLLTSCIEEIEEVI